MAPRELLLAGPWTGALARWGLLLLLLVVLQDPGDSQGHERVLTHAAVLLPEEVEWFFSPKMATTGLPPSRRQRPWTAQAEAARRRHRPRRQGLQPLLQRPWTAQVGAARR